MVVRNFPPVFEPVVDSRSVSEELDYTYRRTWQREAVSAFSTLCFVNLFGLFLLWMMWSFPDSGLGKIVLFVIVVFNNLLFGHHFYSTMKRKQDFVCALANGQLTCDCPDKSGGETFSATISSIQRIEVNDGTVELKMIDGSQHWLTSNYGNPSGYLINSMMVQNPKIELVHA